MPRPRVRLRGLMILVAIVAVGLSLKIRSDRFRRLANFYRMGEFGYSYEYTAATPDLFLLTMPRWARRAPDAPEAFAAKYRAYRAALQRKYASAAARPWMPVAPDPPLPDPGPGVIVRFRGRPTLVGGSAGGP